MLKAAFIPEEENVVLQNELNKTYNKLDYICFVNDLMYALKTPPELTLDMSERLFLVINKIILDNVFKHVAQKSPDKMLEQVQYNTFSKDVFVNVFYVNQILELCILDPLDKQEKENLITKMVYSYLDQLYTSNKERLNEIILNIYNYLNNFFHYLNISYYKFEIIDKRKPILLYTERFLC